MRHSGLDPESRKCLMILDSRLRGNDIIAVTEVDKELPTCNLDENYGDINVHPLPPPAGDTQSTSTPEHAPGFALITPGKSLALRQREVGRISEGTRKINNDIKINCGTVDNVVRVFRPVKQANLKVRTTNSLRKTIFFLSWR